MQICFQVALVIWNPVFLSIYHYYEFNIMKSIL